MAGTGPKMALTPLELLTPNEITNQPPFLSKYYLPVIGATLAGIGVYVANLVTRRPLYSGLHRYAIYMTIGAGLGQLGDQHRNKTMAEKDAILRHYVQLHPEDFPPFERKKYKDVIEPWDPIR